LLPSWTGRARIGISWGVFVGGVGENSRHRHHAIQAVSAPQIKLETERGTIQITNGFVLPPGMVHLASKCDQSAFLYMDPNSSAGRSVMAALGGVPLSLSATDALVLRQIVIETLQDGELARPLERMCNLIGCDSLTVRTPDPRISALIEQIVSSPDAFPDAKAAAASIGLSRSRLVHLFSVEAGVPWRTFLLWIKLRRAFEAVATGSTLTEAAQAGGFADSAHFSRTCRSMFGINPKAITAVLKTRG